MENDMKLIAQGAKTKDVVLRDCIHEMNRIFKRVFESKGSLCSFLEKRALEERKGRP